MNTERYSVEEVIEAINSTQGLMYMAARKLGCTPATLINYRHRYPEIDVAVKARRGEMLDVAEGSLFKAVQEGEAWAVCFFLKTRGKHRGYVERQELTGKSGGPIRTRAVQELSDDELRTIIEEERGSQGDPPAPGSQDETP